MTLDKKQPWSVPDVKNASADVAKYMTSIAGRIKDLKPLGMFRLAESEFLVAFEDCAVYVDQHGDVSRGVVMEFVGKATRACLCGKYLILFDEGFVEVRNAMNGRLRQVIAGRDVRCLDDGGGGNWVNPTGNNGAGGGASQLGSGANGLGIQGSSGGRSSRTVKIAMQHPEYERSQVVVELIENEGQKE